MVTRKRLPTLILLASVAALVILYFTLPKEPVYQGKTLTIWLDQFGTNHWSHRGDLDKQAEAALQHIGTDAVPIYLQMLMAKESPIKVKLLQSVPGTWLARFHIQGVKEYRDELYMRQFLGAYGFAALGAQAKPYVPALLALNSEKDQHTRMLALFALRSIGPAAGAAVPEMIECLKDSDAEICGEAAQGLGEIHQDPERSIPVLMDFIEKNRADRVHIFCYHAIRSLGRFGADAKPAIPMLIDLLNDPNPLLRAGATNAFQFLGIDPEVAAKGEVK